MKLPFFWVQLALGSALWCLVTGSPGKTGKKFSAQEDEFLIKILESKIDTYNVNTWKEIEDAIEEKLNAHAPGFFVKRPGIRLLHHFVYLIKTKNKKVPDSLKQLYEKIKKPHFSCEEKAFIAAVLLSYQGNRYQEKAWVEMKRKHDTLRKAGRPGFSNVRTANSLRMHGRNFILPKIQQMSRDQCAAGKGSTLAEENKQSSSDQSENTDSVSEEANEIWSYILQDMTGMQHGPVDEFGVDPTLFVDRKVDNDIFMPNWPHDIRRFD